MNLEEYLKMLQKMAQRQQKQRDALRRQIDDYHSRFDTKADD